MNYDSSNRSIFYVLITTLFLLSCKSGPFTFFKSASPHEAYERKLINSGLSQTAMGKTWIEVSENVLLSPVSIEIPYLEKGYFPSDKVQAAAFSFEMEHGQKLNVKLTRKPLQGFMVYTDIWEREEEGTYRVIGSADTLGNVFQSDISRTSTYIVRLQPELLAGVEYTLEITAGPSLGYPLANFRNNQIRSFWGDGRDAGSRKHEGVDIFSSFRTPILASAPGTTRVNENNLGGKVVWLRPEGKNYTLYYAHLDEQTVSNGQYVEAGDTLGRMGNTGNAKTTPPHLHFGIYTNGGAVDPLPFINPKIKAIQEISGETPLVNSIARTTNNAFLFNSETENLRNGTVVQVLAASALNYRVELPDGKTGFIPSGKLTGALSRIKSVKLSTLQRHLFDRPDTSAAVKTLLSSDQLVDVVGSFGVYDFIDTGKDKVWIISR
jgi:murein DD-endopeptidase MepM/ murein hydrolase activator NlpD